MVLPSVTSGLGFSSLLVLDAASVSQGLKTRTLAAGVAHRQLNPRDRLLRVLQRGIDMIRRYLFYDSECG